MCRPSHLHRKRVNFILDLLRTHLARHEQWNSIRRQRLVVSFSDQPVNGLPCSGEPWTRTPWATATRSFTNTPATRQYRWPTTEFNPHASKTPGGPMTSATNDQQETYKRFSVTPIAAPQDMKLSKRLSMAGIRGLRHAPAGDTTGWFIWAGEELSDDPDFFVPVHVSHISDWCPNVLSTLHCLLVGGSYLSPDTRTCGSTPRYFTPEKRSGRLS
jgi:hypothetical protein